MPPVTTRPMKWADIDAVTQMITALADHHGDTAQINGATLHRDVFGAHPWVRISVAILDGAPIGYVALCPLAKLQWGTRGMDLHHVYVSPDQRGRGVGRALIVEAKARALGLSCTYLMVGTAPGNAAAQAAYLACGFKTIPDKPNRFVMEI